MIQILSDGLSVLVLGSTRKELRMSTCVFINALTKITIAFTRHQLSQLRVSSMQGLHLICIALMRTKI
jgi:ribosomal protein L20